MLERLFRLLLEMPALKTGGQALSKAQRVRLNLTLLGWPGSFQIMDNSGDIAAGEKSGWIPLHLASQNGHVAVTWMLLDNDPDKSATHQKGWRPIHVASQQGQNAVAQLFMEQDCRLDWNNCILLPGTDIDLSSILPTYLLLL
jgi:ankyrin repeat protein